MCATLKSWQEKAETSQSLLPQRRTIPKSSLLPVILPFSVILSGAKNPILSAETLSSAQGGNSPDFAIVLASMPGSVTFAIQAVRNPKPAFLRKLVLMTARSGNDVKM